MGWTEYNRLMKRGKIRARTCPLNDSFFLTSLALGFFVFLICCRPPALGSHVSASQESSFLNQSLQWETLGMCRAELPNLLRICLRRWSFLLDQITEANVCLSDSYWHFFSFLGDFYLIVAVMRCQEMRWETGGRRKQRSQSGPWPPGCRSIPLLKITLTGSLWLIWMRNIKEYHFITS